MAERDVGVVGVHLERLVLAVPVRPVRAGRPLPVTLHHLPARHVPEQEALMRVVGAYERTRQLWSGWERFLVAWCSGFHALIAFTLAFAPLDQIYNAGTRPVFEIASRYVWAAIFALAALFSAFLLHRQTARVQMLTWLTVLPLGGMWLFAFALAVINGRGSAIGVVVWPFLYGPWAIAAIRIGLGKR